MKKEISDFRSDTVTKPTETMRRSVLYAELGDDVIGSDPTVERLQDMAAEITGKEAALFVTSGTQANIAALMTHCSPGHEVILGETSHIFNNEGGGLARIAGAQPRTLPDPKGRMDPQAIEAAIRPEDEHHPRTRLICTENTHNRAGGMVVSLAHLQAIQAVARDRGLRIHLDGARIFNASVAMGVPVKEFAATADSVSFCLSKGLCCPAGSLLCSTRAFIAEARRARKALGGGLRQVGFLAAPGIVALEEMVKRMAEDHRRARRLAEAFAGLPGIDLDLESVQTNIVFMAVTAMPAARFVTRLREEGVACLGLGDRIRLVTHHDVDDADADRAIAAFRKILTGDTPAP